MNFRTKLILLAVLVNIMVFAGGWYLYSCVKEIQRQVHTFIPLAQYLEGISAVHSNLTRQNKEVLDYLLSHQERDREEFSAIGRELEASFQLWQDAALSQQALSMSGGNEDLARIEDTLKQYRLWKKFTRQLFSLAEQGKREEALRLLHNQDVNPFKVKLLPVLDKALQDGIVEAEDTYHRMLVAVGALPWGCAARAEQLEKIHTSMDFLVGGNRFNANLNNQFFYLLDYLFLGNAQSLLNYEHSRVLSLESFSIWSKTLKNPSLNSFSEQKAPARVATVETSFQSFMEQVEIAVKLKKSGNSEAALAMILSQGDLLITDIHQNTSQLISLGAAQLVTTTGAQNIIGLTLLGLLLLAVGVISVQLSSGLLSTLSILSKGMDNIRDGDLDYRIALQDNDFLGKLAATFNKMMDSLSNSQKELKLLTQDLEERVAERTAELEAKNKDLEAFNSMVSHDLNTPLTVIAGYSEYLLSEGQGFSPTQISAIVKNILEACGDMGNIITALEAFSRASHKQLVLGPLDLGAMVRTKIERFAEDDAGRKVELVVNPTPTAVGDAGLLEIVVTNLTSNAWKYTAKTAEARIEFGAVEQEGERVWYLRDNGVGFDMSKAELLFETFSRLHSQSEFKGSGIGLSTVRRIIQRHGGEIWAESTPNAATTFYFRLGCQPDEAGRAIVEP